MRARARKHYSDMSNLSQDETWRHIRGLRADLPDGLLEKRSGVFSASLEQAEQQFRAAARVPYDSRPLNLFYGLYQAARAVAAVRSEEHDGGRWLLKGGHGIKCVNLSAVSPNNFADFCVKDLDKGSFTDMATILTSASASLGVSMATLWRGLWEPSQNFPLVEGSGAPIVMARPDATISDGWMGMSLDLAHMENPGAAYPNLAVAEVKKSEPAGGPQFFLNVRLRDDLRVYRGMRVFMPRIGEPADLTMHPLLVWWCVLFALSNLARYEPERWTKLLKIDNSPVAAPIEYLLDIALDSVPEIVYDALLGDRF